MASSKKLRSKRKAKRAGTKALRTSRPANSYPRKDGAGPPPGWTPDMIWGSGGHG